MPWLIDDPTTITLPASQTSGSAGQLFAQAQRLAATVTAALSGETAQRVIAGKSAHKVARELNEISESTLLPEQRHKLHWPIGYAVHAFTPECDNFVMLLTKKGEAAEEANFASFRSAENSIDWDGRGFRATAQVLLWTVESVCRIIA